MPGTGIEIQVTGAAGLRKVALQMPAIRELRAARELVADTQRQIDSLEGDKAVQQAEFDRIGSVLREIFVAASPSLDADLEDPLTNVEVAGDPETASSVTIRSGVNAP